MLGKSSKWELGFVHYIAKFTILRFVISRFEHMYILQFSSTSNLLYNHSQILMGILHCCMLLQETMFIQLEKY